uniref:Uncharacterized protein n=1 Tax=Arundo donax TaxID=35708 RepID=A0A0A8YC98_ARUDO
MLCLLSLVTWYSSNSWRNVNLPIHSMPEIIFNGA